MPMANAAVNSTPVRLNWIPTYQGVDAWVGGAFKMSGSGIPAGAIAICGDPTMLAPAGSIDGSVSFPTVSLTTRINWHPVTKTLSERDKITEGPNGKKVLNVNSKLARHVWIAGALMTLHPDLPADKEKYYWDDLWAKYQSSGLHKKYGRDKTHFKQTVVHVLLGAFTNVDFAGAISKYPSDFKEFFKANIYNTHDAKWPKKYFDDVINMSEEDRQFLFDSVRVVNYNEANDRQAVYGLTAGIPDLNPAYLDISKVSLNPKYTDGNSAYSLEGIWYGVYKNSDATGWVGSFSLDAKGKSNKVKVPSPGTYYVQETRSPHGYDLDPTIHKVEVKWRRSGNPNITALQPERRGGRAVMCLQNKLTSEQWLFCSKPRGIKNFEKC